MASRTELRIDQGALRSVLTGPQSEAVKLIRKAQRQTINSAKLRAPVDTGQLRAGHVAGPITVSGSKITTDITATQTYAAAVHDGRKVTIFGPKRAKALSWVGPEIGRLMLANCPPLGLLQVQTLGATYSEGAVILDISGFFGGA